MSSMDDDKDDEDGLDEEEEFEVSMLQAVLKYLYTM